MGSTPLPRNDGWCDGNPRNPKPVADGRRVPGSLTVLLLGQVETGRDPCNVSVGLHSICEALLNSLTVLQHQMADASLPALDRMASLPSSPLGMTLSDVPAYSHSHLLRQPDPQDALPSGMRPSQKSGITCRCSLAFVEGVLMLRRSSSRAGSQESPRKNGCSVSHSVFRNVDRRLTVSLDLRS